MSLLTPIPDHATEAPPRLAGEQAAIWSKPIRDLGLTIKGTRLEPIIAEFEGELDRIGVTRLRPRFYLSTEWGVPFGTVAMAIPFYLARPELTEIHARRVGHVEGMGRADILKYLRHEMGHVVNYAYKLYEDPEWIRLFGSIDIPYPDDYRPKPFSRRFVQHLPGWYAQKHPDEDWSETFAVWMTPGADWRTQYRSWGEALAKLEYCARTAADLLTRDPVVTDVELDEDVADIDYTLDELYESQDVDDESLPAEIDGALRGMIELPADPEALKELGPPRPAAGLILRLEGDLMGDVFRWTGHYPERTRVLVRHLAARAERLGLTYPENAEASVTVAITTIVTALAMNFVMRGAYLP